MTYPLLAIERRRLTTAVSHPDRPDETARARALAAANTPGNAPATDLAMLLLRVFAGLILALAHGLNKVPPSEGFVTMVGELGFPSPLIFAWAAAIAEFVGGLLLALGLLTRPSALLIAVTMTVAAFIAEAGNPFVEKERALLLLGIAIFYLIAGPGRHSVDSMLERRRRSSGARRT